MTRLAFPVVLVAALLVAANAGAAPRAISPVSSGPADGSLPQAPPFSLRALDGKTVRLSDFRGRPVIVDFWATWCAPCRASMPHLEAMETRHRDAGLVVIGLSVDDGDPQAVRRFAERLGVRFRMAMADEKVLDRYGPIRSIPTTFFINRRGQIVRRVVGFLDAETLDNFVREIR